MRAATWRGSLSPRSCAGRSTASPACPCSTSRPWPRITPSLASGCTPTWLGPTRSISARARQVASTFQPWTDLCSWWRGGGSGRGHRSRSIGQRLSMSLGKDPALLPLQHLGQARSSTSGPRQRPAAVGCPPRRRPHSGTSQVFHQCSGGLGISGETPGRSGEQLAAAAAGATARPSRRP